MDAPDRSLTLRMLMRLLEGAHSDGEVVTLLDEHGDRRRQSYAGVAARATRLAGALSALGVSRGDHVGVLSWNVQEQLEAFWAVPCMGATLNSLNPRLLPAELAAAVRQADDRVLLVHPGLRELGEEVAKAAGCVHEVLVFGPDYELRLGSAPAEYGWPELVEDEPAGVCFTSGTSGPPKGVVYSHRTLVLHALTMAAFDPHHVRGRDRVLAVVPMFHSMGWNLPYITALTGASLILPDRHVGAPMLHRLIVEEDVTLSCGVPTVWGDLLRLVETDGLALGRLRAIACGGSRVPAPLMRGFARRGVAVLQGWGMTETGPGAARVHDEPYLSTRERRRRLETSGRVRPLYEIRLRTRDGELAPHDGVATGEIEIRGPMVARSYLGGVGGDRFRDGWLRTGDIGSLDGGGWLRIVDREKDVIKSGGEWISSLALESALLADPAIQDVAVIAAPDARWMERPLACIVAGENIELRTLAAGLQGKVPDWWIPDRFALIAAVPRTPAGKPDKHQLRDRLATGDLEVSVISRSSPAD